MKIEEGNIITLEDNKEYICVRKIIKDNDIYLYLITNKKPVEVKFVKEIDNELELCLETVTDKKLKEELLVLFSGVKE